VSRFCFDRGKYSLHQTHQTINFRYLFLSIAATTVLLYYFSTTTMGFRHYSDTTSADDDYSGDGIPLDRATRSLVIIVHYLGIVFTTFAVYALIKKMNVFNERIWSPFILMVALTWLLLATSFEIGNHYYVDNWQLYDPRADLVNGSFSFFNFGAQNLMAISLRKKGLKFFRCNGTGVLDWIAIICDPILAALIVINPIVYAVFGRSVSVTALSPLAAIAGLFTLFRVWFNLGPNNYTKIGAISFFVLTMCGVIFLAVYNATDIEWVHAFIGGSFISSVIPLSIAFLNAELKEEDNNENEVIEDKKDEEEA